VNNRWPWLRWAFLLTAVVIVIVFLLAQRQTADVSYARSPSGKGGVTAGESENVTLPTVAEMTAMVRKDKVVRLPGAVAFWDEQRITKLAADYAELAGALTEDDPDLAERIEQLTERARELTRTGSPAGSRRRSKRAPSR
jgi:hypothetical protein